MNRWPALLALCCISPLSTASESDRDQIAFFESKIRPIFVQHCYQCHGDATEEPEGGLRLNSRVGWQRGGDSGPTIVPGDVEGSLLIDAVRHSENVVSAMPPSSKLSPEQIDALEHWVASGAVDPRQDDAGSDEVLGFDLQSRFEQHWSWRPVETVDVPMADVFADWSHPIDRFIGRGIDAAGLRPALPADRPTWLRRVTFDLTGLPADTDAIDAYVRDASPDADAAVVDRLLASPAFGEAWARHWMDLVRYAESHGHEFDYPIENAFRYRDYLIRAFNVDVPYDQLIREHLAGDLIDPPRIDPANGWNESVIGTGFWFLHEATHAPTDVQKHEADIIDNQIDVLSKTFLGLTVSCARCHDHKFDAISAEDYYALSAYSQSSVRQNYPQDTDGRIAADTKTIRQLLADASEEAKANADTETSIPDADCFVDFHGDALPKGWSTTGLAFEPIGDKPMVSLDGGIAVANTVDSGRSGNRQFGTLRSPTFTITTNNIHVLLKADHLVMARVVIDHFDLVTRHELLFRGTMLRGKSIDTGGRWAWKSFGNDLRKYVGRRAYLEFVDEGRGSISIDKVVFSDGGAAGVTDVRTSDVTLDPIAGQLASQAKTIADRLAEPEWVIAMAEGTVETASVAIRGNPHNVGKPVAARTLSALGGDESGGDKNRGGKNSDSRSRLALADSIASPTNPLSSRVLVNRLWHHLFGRGIVSTPDDFGPQGQPPSDLELLDWLAADFVHGGWSIKRSIRQIVLSRTYRQSSSSHPDVDPTRIAAVDPTNVLLHRMPVRRLSAEAIRDSVMAISGRMDASAFGPSIATHHTEFMQGRGKRAGGPIDGEGRRSVYLSVDRNFLSPFFQTFDMPSPFGPQGRRSRSNVPAQSLAMMNDPMVLGEATRWADSVCRDETRTTAEKIERLFVQATAMKPSLEQFAGLEQFLKEQSAAYADADQTEDASQSADRQAWVDLAHLILNLKSFVFLR